MKHRHDEMGRDVEDPKARPGERRPDAERWRQGALAWDDAALQARLNRLEARLDATPPTDDAHVNALYGGLRTLVAELIRRRRQAEETCERLSRVLEATSDGFVALDSEWRYVYVNEHAGRMFGRDPSSLVGKHIWTEFPEGVGQPFHLAYERASATREPQRLEAYYPPYDRWFENRIFPYEGGLAIFFQDVTERRLADARLRESEARYRSLFEHHPDAVYSFDLEGRFTSANPACETLTGYLPAELIGESYTKVVVPEHHPLSSEGFRIAAAGSANAYEVAIHHKSGRRVDIAVTKIPIVVGGEVVGVYGIAKDLTGQRALEAQLQHAQKMEAVGRLAGGVAHDFNNLLTIIQSCTTFVAAGLAHSDPLQADVKEVLKAAGRASELTRRLLAFSRKQVLQPRVLDVNRQVASVVEMLRRVIGEDVTLETELDPAAWPVFADPGQLEQVLMNLAVNARDAMPGGGRLVLRTANVTLDAAQVRSRPGLEPGDYVSLGVEDTGTGIDPAVLPIIFEPFVTTKGPGVGTGLGLATVYGIVEQSGGHIDVDTRPGQGSRFSVLLPRAGTSPARGRAPAAAAAPRGSETVLLVEDDAAVRSVVRRMLESQGYTVLAAGDGAEALRILEAPDARVDLVLTDVVLPRENGRALVEELSARWPDLRVLFMSGYPNDEILRRGVTESRAAFLQKPFTPGELARAVRRVLDGVREDDGT